VADRAPSEARIITDIEAILGSVLPPGWVLDVERGPRTSLAERPDLIATVTSPNGDRVVYVGEVKRDSSGRQMRNAIERLRSHTARLPGSRPLFLAPWVGERSRELLTAEGVGFVDVTGNVRLTADRPGLFVAAEGASKNPWPADKVLQSLRGRGTARALRALLDFAPPYGVRELAARSGASAATLSRTIELLEREALVESDDRGAVVDLDWAGTIRRWSQDYDVLRSNDGVGYLQPRGLPSLVKVLKSTRLRYALTGSLAATELAPIAPARLGMVYVDDVRGAAAVLDLREVDAGANVTLLEPYDDVVYARSIDWQGLRIVNPTQLAVDLLTGPGRAPSEGVEILAWMEGHTDVWRS
jgi:hypothetical protein